MSTAEVGVPEVSAAEPTFGVQTIVGSSPLLREAMKLAADRDMVARQYANEFADVFDFGVPAFVDALARFGCVEAAIIDHPNHDRVGAGPLRLRGSPGDQTRGADRQAARTAHQAEGKDVRWQVWVGS